MWCLLSGEGGEGAVYAVAVAALRGARLGQGEGRRGGLGGEGGAGQRGHRGGGHRGQRGQGAASHPGGLPLPRQQTPHLTTRSTIGSNIFDIDTVINMCICLHNIQRWPLSC